MVDALPYLIGSASPEASAAVQLRNRPPRRLAAMTRPSSGIGAAARAHHVQPTVLQLGAAGALALNASVPLLELWRIAIGVAAPIVDYAVVATIVSIALHLRHVLVGLRNDRPASSLWTLTALAVVNLSAAILVGRVWALQFASLAVSILIVLRGPSAFALVGAVTVAPLILARTPLAVWKIDHVDFFTNLPTAHLVMTIAWRTVLLYVPIRLVVMIQQLDAARRSLESRAVIQARTRIEGELRNGLELALQRIISDGDAASGIITRDPVRASAMLGELVSNSRRALTEARRIAAGYRNGSLRAEIDAATSLLQAAGSTCRVVAGEIPLHAASTQASGAIRSAVIRALADGEQKGRYLMRVDPDEDGGVRVVLVSEGPESESQA